MNMTVLIKKCTYWLLLATLVIGSFCNAWLNEIEHITVNWQADTNYTNNSADMVCVKVSWNCTFYFNFNHSNNAYTYLSTSYSIWDYEWLCSEWWQIYYQSVNDTCVMDFYSYKYDNYTSQQCQTEYNLIPIESVDSQYCTDNNLCTNEWWSGDGETSRSALYINDIQHPWSALINITIPEELQRDYTGDEEEMNIDVEWYWYDQEKMQTLVNTQYYTPTPEDMSSLVGKIADFLPLLAIMLLIVRAWYLIKKVF